MNHWAYGTDCEIKNATKFVVGKLKKRLPEMYWRSLEFDIKRALNEKTTTRLDKSRRVSTYASVLGFCVGGADFLFILLIDS
jgi:hypothetical protein